MQGNFDFNIKITGENYQQIKEYLYDTYVEYFEI